jgi:hypothetical protein
VVAWKLQVQAGTKAVRASEKEEGGGVRERRRVLRSRETANQGKRLNMSKTVTVFKWSLARGVPKAGQRRRHVWKLVGMGDGDGNGNGGTQDPRPKQMQMQVHDAW